MPTYVEDESIQNSKLAVNDVIPPNPSAKQADQYVLLLIIMLCVIVVPLVASLFSIVVTVLSDTDFKIPVNGRLGKLLFAVAADPNRYMGSITSILLPTSAAVTAANYDKIDVRGWGSTLFLVPLAGLIAALVAALLVDVTFGDETKDSKTISNMYLNMSASLAVYVMMLVGLKAGVGTSASRNANGSE